jgi:aldehyde dehydrogenase (NAD+)
MTASQVSRVPVQFPEQLFIGGRWVSPNSTSVFHIIEAATEQLYFDVAEADEADMGAAINAARQAFDEGPWPRMSHAERATYLKAMAAGLGERADAAAGIWSRETGVVHRGALNVLRAIPQVWEWYADLADTYPFEKPVTPTAGDHGLLIREPVGVVGAIIPWNGPMTMITYKVAPALLAGCTVVLKCSPEAPGAGYLIAEVAEAVGLPPGVFNVITADRPVSELLVRDPRVDKITFTGSTAAGRRIAALCGERIARCTLELGGKSAAIVLDDADLTAAAKTIARAECFVTGQVCASLTRVVVSRQRHDALVEALAEAFSSVRVGDPFDPHVGMGPLAMKRQLDRVLGYIATGIEEGARLAAGGRRPDHLDHGWFVEPTVFAGVDNSATIARDEIFGPVLSVIPADDEADAVRIANDSIYGLNASVFTPDAERAYTIARRLRSGTVGHNAVRTDFGVAFGGFKQSGIGREGGIEGLLPFLETKLVVLDEPAGPTAATSAT